MSEEKQIEEMANVIKSSLDGLGRGNFNFTGNEISTMFAKALYAAGYRKQAWISVEERLPEENGRYLVNVDIAHLAFEKLFTVAIMEYGKNHGFYLYSDTEKVTHWMPLPEPPKGE